MSAFDPTCDHCPATARWSIQNWEDVDYADDLQPIVRWLVCGRHVHRALDQGRWAMDAVQVMDLSVGEVTS